MGTPTFRPNVAAIVLNPSNLLLACQRSDLPHIWQLPQGGIEPGELPLNALFRELEEEIGTACVEVIWQRSEPISYLWPEHLRTAEHCGQLQHYFAVRLNNEALIKISRDPAVDEFINYRWMRYSEFLAGLVGFKKDAYTLAISEVMQIFPQE